MADASNVNDDDDTIRQEALFNKITEVAEGMIRERGLGPTSSFILIDELEE
ncbi:hypothetical protein HanHA300_Chr01g0020831 [Helianthus annuus]|nr:hypothetical protein HanHA300_Chr01g0020831 [Helianthus annuus]KAJ0627239.1 hypothetical protein HanHA89_Chr01g0023081 [Helianthus annuus]